MLKSDRSIRRNARQHDMINPFSEKQVREGVISYGLSSYGYDLRVADENREARGKSVRISCRGKPRRLRHCDPLRTLTR
jgi:deoxycytidine triphosphate deaminase